MRSWILLLGLALAVAGAASAQERAGAPAARTDLGRLDGVAYRIDLPAQWNGDLVMYFHGYEPGPVEYEGSQLEADLALLLERGYAIAQSAYGGTGWVVDRALADSERVRRHFVARHGRARHTYAVGHSMGGLLTVQALEARSPVYAGGLALCGAIGGGDRVGQRLFALRAAFDHYLPDLFGPLAPVPADYRMSKALKARVLAALREAPQAAAALRALSGEGSDEALAGDFVFVTELIRNVQQRSGGNPFGNADLVYSGSGDDGPLNDGVRRYRADPAAAAWLARHYTPSGRLERPLLALHTTADVLVPPATAFEYALSVQRTQRDARFVQQYVTADGHCEFTPQQTAQAFDALVGWAERGARPASGPLR